MISSITNSHIKHIRSLLADRRERRRERMFVLEGVRLVADALAHGGAIERAIYAPEQLERMPGAYAATPQAMAAAADTVHPQGVVALARWPEIEPSRPGIVLVLDG